MGQKYCSPSLHFHSSSPVIYHSMLMCLECQAHPATGAHGVCYRNRNGRNLLTIHRKRTATFLKSTHLAILNDKSNRLKPTDKKGVSCAMHFKSLAPQDFVPPLLHMEIGMVNNAWDGFEQWIDDTVEMIPPHKQDARKKLDEARQKLDEALAERSEVEKTINIEIREKSGEVKRLKSEL
jgi:hypothetical protein